MCPACDSYNSTLRLFSVLLVMREHVETDRQLCFANRPSSNKHYANHSPNESVSPGPIQLENKCLHLTQHGGRSTGKNLFLNTQNFSAKESNLL